MVIIAINCKDRETSFIPFASSTPIVIRGTGICAQTIVEKRKTIENKNKVKYTPLLIIP
jgi:hypothetical protein